MFVNIHTHNSLDLHNPAILNLTFDEAKNIFASDTKGLFSLGFHPWHADKFSKERMDKLIEWTKDKRLVAIGECGMDKNSKVSMDIQQFVFEQQIALSEKVEKPLIIHCVGSFNELFDLKKKWKPIQRWIIHGFRGKPELAHQALKAVCGLSFGEYFNIESVRLTPTESLFIETDESHLSISDNYRQIANIKNCRVEELNAGETLLKSFNSFQSNFGLLK